MFSPAAMIVRRSPGKGEKINMKLRLPICPYCGKKVGFTKAWYLKKEGEYRCPECGGYSNILLDPLSPLLGTLAILCSILIFLLVRFLAGGISFWGILLMLFPYLLFFLFSVFLIRLRKPVFRKRTDPPPRRPGGQNPRPGNGGFHHIKRQ